MVMLHGRDGGGVPTVRRKGRSGAITVDAAPFVSTAPAKSMCDDGAMRCINDYNIILLCCRVFESGL